jgi:hypothetical protein
VHSCSHVSRIPPPYPSLRERDGTNIKTYQCLSLSDISHSRVFRTWQFVLHSALPALPLTTTNTSSLPPVPLPQFSIAGVLWGSHDQPIQRVLVRLGIRVSDLLLYFLALTLVWPSHFLYRYPLFFGPSRHSFCCAPNCHCLRCRAKIGCGYTLAPHPVCVNLMAFFVCLCPTLLSPFPLLSPAIDPTRFYPHQVVRATFAKLSSGHRCATGIEPRPRVRGVLFFFCLPSFFLSFFSSASLLLHIFSDLEMRITGSRAQKSDHIDERLNHKR